MTGNPLIPVFDVGGVLLDWNPRHLYRKLFDNEAEMERFLATVCTPSWNLEMDGGKPFATGVAELSARFPERARLIRAFHERWQEMVPRAIDGTVTILRDLKRRGHALYAITNFSAEKFALERRRWSFLKLFDGVVVSGEVGVVKPDPAIYRRLLDDYGLDPASCLFIDDSPANVAGAQAVGMRGHRFTDPEILQRALGENGLI
jgi:2-haloacid dehalogenase